MRKILMIAVPAILIATAGLAASPNAAVSDAWIRALPANTPSGGYFTLTNNGGNSLTLTGATSPACGMLMLHKSDMAGGMMHMEHVTAIDIPAHGKLAFAPGGYHLMCMDASPAIKPGNNIEVTLTFKGGDTLAAKFAVRNANGR
ncbi:MAG: copper chaperone PCu(A)C [Alphaproteobacteria bacterium]|nr:copper chaperone PCu(A)C [Alphaproteobacteria bacterium]